MTFGTPIRCLECYHKWKIGFESLKRGLMINWSNLTFLFFGALGTFVLLLLQWIISWRLPNYPAQAIESLRNVQRTTAEGEYEGMQIFIIWIAP